MTPTMFGGLRTGDTIRRSFIRATDTGSDPGIDIGLCFGGWGGWGFGGGWGWGWGPNWFGGGVFVNNAFFNRYGYHHGFGFGGGSQGRTAWAHDPGHRLGVAYPNSQLNGRFGAASQASRIAAGQSGNWHRFGEGNVGGNSFRGATPQAGARNSQASLGASGWQHFQGRQGLRHNAIKGRRNAIKGRRNAIRGRRNAIRSAQSYRASGAELSVGARVTVATVAAGCLAVSVVVGLRSFGGGGASTVAAAAEASTVAAVAEASTAAVAGEEASTVAVAEGRYPPWH